MVACKGKVREVHKPGCRRMSPACPSPHSHLLIWQSHLIVPWVFEAGYGHFAPQPSRHPPPLPCAIPASPSFEIVRTPTRARSDTCARTSFVHYLPLLCVLSAASLLAVYMHVLVRTASRITFEREKERKQTTHKRDRGGGQGPHLHEQDFGRTIRGTGGLSCS